LILPTYEYDFFIAHASEDKDAVVDPLAEILISKGFRVWYDKYELRMGDSLRQEIDRGLARSQPRNCVGERSSFRYGTS
jgi:hypothetical protein